MEKLVPQPHEAVALGLWTLKEEPIRSSTKSISEPARYCSETGSISTRAPARSITRSSGSEAGTGGKLCGERRAPPPPPPSRRRGVSGSPAAISAMRLAARSDRLTAAGSASWADRLMAPFVGCAVPARRGPLGQGRARRCLTSAKDRIAARLVKSGVLHGNWEPNAVASPRCPTAPLTCACSLCCGGRGQRRQAAQRARVPDADTLSTRPGPHRARHRLPTPHLQDAGVRLPRGGPLSNAPHPQPGGGADRPCHGPHARARRGFGRGAGPGPRSGPPALWPRRRAGLGGGNRILWWV